MVVEVVGGRVVTTAAAVVVEVVLTEWKRWGIQQQPYCSPGIHRSYRFDHGVPFTLGSCDMLFNTWYMVLDYTSTRFQPLPHFFHLDLVFVPFKIDHQRQLFSAEKAFCFLSIAE